MYLRTSQVSFSACSGVRPETPKMLLTYSGVAGLPPSVIRNNSASAIFLSHNSRTSIIRGRVNGACTSFICIEVPSKRRLRQTFRIRLIRICLLIQQIRGGSPSLPKHLVPPLLLITNSFPNPAAIFISATGGSHRVLSLVLVLRESPQEKTDLLTGDRLFLECPILILFYTRTKPISCPLIKRTPTRVIKRMGVQ